MKKIPSFDITICAAIMNLGVPQVDIMRPLKEIKVTCPVDQLRAEMAKAALGVKSDDPMMPGLHVCAFPPGRNPAGFDAFEAARQNEFYIAPAATGTAKDASAHPA